MQPRLLTDGRYAVSDATLTDPAHAAVLSVLQAGASETVAAAAYTTYGDFTLWVDGKPLRLASASVGRALSSPADGVFRMELQANDFGHIDDATINGNKRSEFIATGASSTYGDGASLWQSWTTILGTEHAGLYLAGKQGIVMQLHSIDYAVSVGRTPVLVVDLSSGLVQIITRSSAEISPGSESGVTKVRYSAALPAAGVPLRIVLHSTLGEAGYLEAWVDGVKVVDAAMPIGYYTDLAYGLPLGEPHWGLYMKNTPTLDVAYMANLEWGTTSLLDRVATPLVVPEVAW